MAYIDGNNVTPYEEEGGLYVAFKTIAPVIVLYVHEIGFDVNVDEIVRNRGRERNRESQLSHLGAH